MSESEKHDKVVVDNWKAHADSMLIFVRQIYLLPRELPHFNYNYNSLDGSILHDNRLIFYRDLQDSHP